MSSQSVETSSSRYHRAYATYYRKRTRNAPALIGIFVTFMLVSFIHRHGIFSHTTPRENSIPIHAGERRLLQAATDDQREIQLTTELIQFSPNACTPRSVEEFPQDFMSLADKKRGGVVLHALLAIYMFIAVAVVCDDYFVASLERICEVTKLKPDVAGATFMAAGSSAPELFTSLIGVFITESDVGISTIVGSAVFNVLCIVALCGIFAGVVVRLTWWPLARDSGCYCLSILALVFIIFDGAVYWYEAVVFLLMYAGYIGIMYFNTNIEDYLKRNYSSSSEIEVQPLMGGSSASKRSGYDSLEDEDASRRRQEESDEEEFESPLTVPESLGKRIYWAAMLPVTIVLMFTIPDCRRPGIWKRLYVLTFLISVLWIAIMSYLLVWMVCIVGDTLEIPETIMGLTLLAAGTSVPDALASVFVSRDGYGDMAVSNGIGSNVFDILMCLGLPWALKTVIMNPGGSVLILSSGLTFSSLTLFSTVILLVIVVRCNNWRLTRPLGFSMLAIYFVVIGFCCLYEMNLLVPGVNPPVCDRKRF